MKHVMEQWLIVCAIGAAILATSCDVVTDPLEKPIVPPDTSEAVVQNVLLEDYTGHLCGNCPAAADRAKEIQTLYGKKRVIVVAVHSGHFARTNPEYPTDWRTPEGEELNTAFGNSRAGNPNGLVNRRERNGKFILSVQDWASATAQELERTPELGIKATTQWDAATRTVTAAVELNYLTAGDPDNYLVGYLIEDGLVGDQLDYRVNPSHVEEFEFEHVLRASMTGTWGEQVSPTAIASGTKIQKQLQYTFPADKTWKPENCHLVFFVHRYNNPDTKEVLQVISVPVIAS